jgi:hypothetical protein
MTGLPVRHSETRVIQMKWDANHNDVSGNKAHGFADECGLMMQDMLAPALGMNEARRP